ncbi:MAG: NAD-dependent epimerase/dehydratase family protein [Anaerolineae bacterium]|nr:NAD-dependent epimerase/dehydratase family protein [Anaerolineae bacterium]
MNRGRIFVLGGDGFCGWPTSLRLSSEGYDVTIVDNLSRRKIDVELGCRSLTPIETIDTRLRVWQEMTGRTIDYVDIDLSEDYHELLYLLRMQKPHTIVHFAEQRAAPYSMKSARHKRYTVDNNINGTHNVLCAIVEAGIDVHLVHLGTMGVYGYGTAGMTIPEGYLTVKVDIEGRDQEIEIPYPPHPGSIYHMTKTMDALLFHYYNKNDNVRITDLHQGVVWGTNTEETLMHPALINRFDYEGDYGTVLNRFMVQAAVGHPLTVYGHGGQTRAFIHIRDTVCCISLAITSPPSSGDRVQIFNQATETHCVQDLAELVAQLTGAEIRYYVNPRNEAWRNELIIRNDKFRQLGLNPITLSEGLLIEVFDVAAKYKDRINMDKILPSSRWREDIPFDRQGSEAPEVLHEPQKKAVVTSSENNGVERQSKL